MDEELKSCSQWRKQGLCLAQTFLCEKAEWVAPSVGKEHARIWAGKSATHVREKRDKACSHGERKIMNRLLYPCVLHEGLSGEKHALKAGVLQRQSIAMPANQKPLG